MDPHLENEIEDHQYNRTYRKFNRENYREEGYTDLTAEDSDKNGGKCYFSQKILPYIEEQLDKKLHAYMQKHVEECTSCKLKFSKISHSLSLVSKYVVKKNISDFSRDEIKREIVFLTERIFEEKDRLIRGDESGLKKGLKIVRGLASSMSKLFSSN